jgi:TorA maturation chaperone TorD
MTPSDLAASAEDRSRFFWWLAQWFLHPPAQEQLDSLPRSEDLAEEGDEDPFPRAWRALALAAPMPEQTQELGVEYTRLCAGLMEGSGPPPPYESVWREDRLMGEATVAVIEQYAQAGFADICPEAGPQDHLAVELRFIALLALREAEAWQAGDAAEAARRQGHQHAFLRDHLLVWTPRWAAALAAQARLPMYRALAELLPPTLEVALIETRSPTP